MSCAVSVPQYFTMLTLLSCNLVHNELNSFFLTFIWREFSQQTVRHNWFADIPCSPGLGEWIKWIRGKNANHSSMPLCAPGVCNVRMCWAKPLVGKGWGEVWVFGVEDGEVSKSASCKVQSNEELPPNSEGKGISTPLRKTSGENFLHFALSYFSSQKTANLGQAPNNIFPGDVVSGWWIG